MEEMILNGHPYSRPADGTKASMTSITADDLKQFVRQRFVRSRLVVSIVGDVSPAEAKAFVDQAFGGLPEDVPLAEVAPIQPSKQGRARVVDFDVPQAIVQFAEPGIPRSDPDFFPAYLVNYVLGGGGFSARLMNEVREKRGLVYGIGTDLWTFDAGGLIAGQFQTDPGKVAQAIEIVRTEWQRMASEGPTQQELDDAKTYLLGYYPRNFTNTMDTAQLLRGLQTEGLGIDYVTRRQKEIAAVTIADTQARGQAPVRCGDADVRGGGTGGPDHAARRGSREGAGAELSACCAALSLPPSCHPGLEPGSIAEPLLQWMNGPGSRHCVAFRGAGYLLFPLSGGRPAFSRCLSTEDFPVSPAWACSAW